MEKLTAEELATRNATIIDWVENNRSIPDAAKFGILRQITVQEILASGVGTLRAMLVSVKDVIGNDDPELRDDGEEIYYAPGVKAEPFAAFLRIVIREKKEREKREAIEKKLRAERAKLKSLATPEETKEALKADIAKLEAELA